MRRGHEVIALSKSNPAAAHGIARTELSTAQKPTASPHSASKPGLTSLSTARHVQPRDRRSPSGAGRKNQRRAPSPSGTDLHPLGCPLPAYLHRHGLRRSQRRPLPLHRHALPDQSLWPDQTHGRARDSGAQHRRSGRPAHPDPNGSSPGGQRSVHEGVIQEWAANALLSAMKCASPPQPQRRRSSARAQRTPRSAWHLPLGRQGNRQPLRNGTAYLATLRPPTRQHRIRLQARRPVRRPPQQPDLQPDPIVSKLKTQAINPEQQPKNSLTSNHCEAKHSSIPRSSFTVEPGGSTFCSSHYPMPTATPPPIWPSMQPARFNAAGVAVLRHYGWSEPAITFGCTQRIKDVRNTVDTDLTLCRRTWAVASSITATTGLTPWSSTPQCPLPASLRSTCFKLRKAIQATLLKLEVASQLAPCPKACRTPHSTCPRTPHRTPPMADQCFVQAAANDVLNLTGAKIAGAAMKRRAACSFKAPSTAQPCSKTSTSTASAKRLAQLAHAGSRNGHSNDLRALLDGLRTAGAGTLPVSSLFKNAEIIHRDRA